METRASSEPEVAEVLPQHKFDYRSLEAYLNQHLPSFAAEPEAKLTVAQYRYWHRPSPTKTNLCIVLFPSSFGLGGLLIHPTIVSFHIITHSAGGSCHHLSPTFRSGINSRTVMEALWDIKKALSQLLSYNH